MHDKVQADKLALSETEGDCGEEARKNDDRVHAVLIDEVGDEEFSRLAALPDFGQRGPCVLESRYARLKGRTVLQVSVTGQEEKGGKGKNGEERRGHEPDELKPSGPGQRERDEQRKDGARVPHAETPARNPPLMINGRDLRQEGVVKYEAALHADIRQGYQDEPDENFPRGQRREDRHGCDAEERIEPEEPFPQPRVVGDAAEKGRGKGHEEHAQGDSPSPPEIPGAGAVADDDVGVVDREDHRRDHRGIARVREIEETPADDLLSVHEVFRGRLFSVIILTAAYTMSAMRFSSFAVIASGGMSTITFPRGRMISPCFRHSRTTRMPTLSSSG